ncbi:unnamed protein product [Cylicocyclus nassatus]|uniref:Apple domain-containing protein n=1 Tax=Cylicocyclus nassatus TaxID=53992 RepID=A0AA36DT86_CYLNA|nr:unnamed protein product [Cylicocyclus nassatus]
MWFITKVLFVLSATKMTLSSGVFRYTPSYLHGGYVYYFNPGDRVQCLRACYEESECVFVTYNEGTNHCNLYRQGNSTKSNGYVLTREETDASCTTELASDNISFQKIPHRVNSTKSECNNTARHDVAVIKYYDHFNYRFFLHSSMKEGNWGRSVGNFSLLFSKKTAENCTSVPVFHKANLRRLYFGEAYNTTGYYFYNAYAFADYCTTPKGECLGVQEIQEYVDEKGFFYDEPRREDITDSGLGQTFFIVGKENITKLP